MRDITPGTVLSGPNGQAITVGARVGKGGLGQVFSATLADSSRVAVKTVLDLDNTGHLLALRNEADHIVTIDHPNVVRVLSVDLGDGPEGNPPHIVMEFVDGGDLEKAIERHRSARTQFSVAELRAMFLQISEGMRAVNATIVHRDLKPQNIMVDASAGLLKIADFGIAKIADATTRKGTFKGWGSGPYRSPESFDGETNTVAMDVYSAGVVFYLLAALQLPFQPDADADTYAAWRGAHLYSTPQKLDDLRSDLPLELAQLILLMLQKNPVRRPSWDQVISAVTRDVLPNGHLPNVTSLVQKATATVVREGEREITARRNQESAADRSERIAHAFEEPLGILRGLVSAFNDATSVDRLTMTTTGLSAEVRSAKGTSCIVLEGIDIDDLGTFTNDIYRAVALVKIVPTPTNARAGDSDCDDSFPSFNLVYKVLDSTDKFGTWMQLRFEQPARRGRASTDKWQGRELEKMILQLGVLHMSGRLRHEIRELDDVWFQILLTQLL